MRSRMVVLMSGVLACAWACWAVLADQPRQGDAPRPDPKLIERGDYLVNEVARCGDCHTPRDARGRPDGTRLLQGAEMWFTPRVRTGEWEGHAPDITSSGKGGRWTEAKMVRLLTGGEESDAPMPTYHLTEEDARAVAVYLRSLPGKGGGDRKGNEDRDRRRKKERDDD